MARPETPTIASESLPTLTPGIGDNVNSLVATELQMRENAQALAQQLSYEGPITPDALESGIRDSQQRVSMELFAIGARLLLIKEQSHHGEFIERIKRLDITQRMAQKFMQVSLKFANAPLTAHLQKLGKTKLIELLALDDDEVEQLGEEGSVRGLELDAIDRMSCSELRQKLRDAQTQNDAKDRLIANKNEKLDELAEKSLAAPKMDTPDLYLADQLSQLTALTNQIYTTLGITLSEILRNVLDHHALHGGDSNQIMSGCLSQIETQLLEIREIYPQITDVNDDWDPNSEE